MNNIEIATIFLDEQLRVKRFTPQARTVAHLIDSDVGRPLADLAPLLDYPGSAGGCSGACSRACTHRRNRRRARDGSLVPVRIRPYRTARNVVEGLVVTFIDITETSARERVQAARVLAESIVDAVREPFLVLDAIAARRAGEPLLLPRVPGRAGRDRRPSDRRPGRQAVGHPARSGTAWSARCATHGASTTSRWTARVPQPRETEAGLERSPAVAQGRYAAELIVLGIEAWPGRAAGAAMRTERSRVSTETNRLFEPARPPPRRAPERRRRPIDLENVTPDEIRNHPRVGSPQDRAATPERPARRRRRTAEEVQERYRALYESTPIGLLTLDATG